MINFRNFFFMLTLGVCLFFYNAHADTDPMPQDPKLRAYFENDSYVPGSTKKTLCQSGYYLARCGQGIALGTNWLKGIQETTKGVETADYYSYGKPASDTIHISNLRKFFAAKESFSYTDKDGNPETAELQNYEPDKNQMLSRICTDDNGLLFGIECERCPGDASVPASYVEQAPNGKLLWRTWDVHSIADCYMEEFSDNTGTYKYVPSNIEPNINSAALPCYYSVNIPGTKP